MRVKSFLCTLVHEIVVIFVKTDVYVQSCLCKPMCVYSHFCIHSCLYTVIFLNTDVHVQSFLCQLMSVYSHFCVQPSACTGTFCKPM